MEAVSRGKKIGFMSASPAESVIRQWVFLMCALILCILASCHAAPYRAAGNLAYHVSAGMNETALNAHLTKPSTR